MTYTTSRMVTRNLKFAVAQDFSQNGVTATWASGHPARLSAAESEISLQAAPSHNPSVSPDEKWLSISADGAIYIYFLEDLTLRSTLSFHPYSVGAVRWQPAKDFTDGYLVVVSVRRPSRSRDPDLKKLVVVLRLDPTGQFTETGDQIPVDTEDVAKSTTRELARILETRYSWNNTEANDPKFQEGVSEILKKACALRYVSKKPHVEGGLSSFESPAFSNDGGSIIVRGERYHEESEDSVQNVLDIWQIDGVSPQKRFSLQGHEDDIMWAAFSPNGEVIASSCWDGTVKIWSAATGEMLKSIGPSGGQNWTGAFSPDGKLIAYGTGGSGAKISICNVTTGENLYNENTSRGWVRTLSWSPDGQYLAYGSEDGNFHILSVAPDAQSGNLTFESLQHWKIDFSSYPRGRGFVEIHGVQWLDNSRIMFDTGHAISNVLIYDVERNVKWHFSPDEEGDSADRGKENETSLSGLWLSRKQQLLVSGPDSKIRFFNVE